MAERSVVLPKPIRKFNREFLIFIPFDPIPSFLGASIRKKASLYRNIGAGTLFLLERSAVLYQTMGAPAAVLWLETLIASGISRILLLSFCGSLSPRLKIGDAVSLERAWADEGTSGHYFPGQRIFRASPAFDRQIRGFLRRAHLPFSAASAVSTDAPYRETRAWLRRMQAKGMEAVDMEASAVFALAKYRGARAAGLLLVSDELFSGTWKDDFPRPLLRKKIEDYFLPFLEGLPPGRRAKP